jgi:hypothetical protein
MKYDMKRRFAFIEARLLWGGGVTAGEVADAFGIARQNAQAVISSYRTRHPGQMEYDRRRRSQVRTEGFKTHYIHDDVGRFLDYQRAVSHTARFFDDPDWADLPFIDADVLVRPFYEKRAVATLLEALQREVVVEIEYWSKKTGQRIRRISPHHLVSVDGRYHVRAYCHEHSTYLDFVLTRIVAADLVDEPWISGEADEAWHRRIDISFQMNTDLADRAKSAIRIDYIMDGSDVLTIKGVREALVYYVKRRLCRDDGQFNMPLWVMVNGE